MVSEIVENLVESEGKSKWVANYTPPFPTNIHQFCVFLKPEVLAGEKDQLANIVSTVFDCFAEFDVTIGAIRILSAHDLGEYQIMDRHYGVINRTSKNGADSISPAALQLLKENFAEDLANGADVVGGHQFLNQNPAMSARELSTTVDNLGSFKLAGGTYCTRFVNEGKIYLVLNGFHPYQLEHFTSAGQRILVMEGRSVTGWKRLRQELIGATDPEKAQSGSIRRILLERADELHLGPITQGTNGIHLSAGPLEGVAELLRFFDDFDTPSLKPEDTSFGALLINQGSDRNDLLSWIENPIARFAEKAEPMFDATEELDAADAAQAINNSTI